MKRAYIFPGQGSQFSGMGKELYETSAAAKNIFDKANEIDTTFELTGIDLVNALTIHSLFVNRLTEVIDHFDGADILGSFYVDEIFSRIRINLQRSELVINYAYAEGFANLVAGSRF